MQGTCLIRTSCPRADIRNMNATTAFSYASPEKPRRKHLLPSRSTKIRQPKRSCGYLLADDHSRQAPALRAAMLATMRHDRSCDFFGDQRRRTDDLEPEARWSASYTSSVTMLDRCRQSIRRLSVSKAAPSRCAIEGGGGRAGQTKRFRLPLLRPCVLHWVQAIS